MEIQKINFHNFRNAGHYQFHSDFVTLVTKYSHQALGISELYAEYSLLYSDEGTVLKAITKSATTAEIEIGDKSRDFTFRGFCDKAKNGLNHFNPAVREAAARVMVILDTYGNLAPMPNDEESGLITGLLAELRLNVPADLEILGLVEWADELEAQNKNVISLQAARNSEKANRTELRMKEVRVDVDAVYNKIVKRINALIIVNGETPYSEFVKELNARISRAKDAIAHSKANKAEDPAPQV